MNVRQHIRELLLRGLCQCLCLSMFVFVRVCACASVRMYIIPSTISYFEYEISVCCELMLCAEQLFELYGIVADLENPPPPSPYISLFLVLLYEIHMRCSVSQPIKSQPLYYPKSKQCYQWCNMQRQNIRNFTSLLVTLHPAHRHLHMHIKPKMCASKPKSLTFKVSYTQDKQTHMHARNACQMAE